VAASRALRLHDVQEQSKHAGKRHMAIQTACSPLLRTRTREKDGTPIAALSVLAKHMQHARRQQRSRRVSVQHQHPQHAIDNAHRAMSCRTWGLRHLRQMLRLCVRLQTACLLPLRSSAPCPQRRQPHQLLLLLQRRPLGPCASLVLGCGCLLVDLGTLETGRLQPVFEKQGITAHSLLPYEENIKHKIGAQLLLLGQGRAATVCSQHACVRGL
jgi:hypothetical protein